MSKCTCLPQAAFKYLCIYPFTRVLKGNSSVPFKTVKTGLTISVSIHSCNEWENCWLPFFGLTVWLLYSPLHPHTCTFHIAKFLSDLWVNAHAYHKLLSNIYVYTLLHECSNATPVFLSKLSKQDWQLASAFIAVMNGTTVDFRSVGLTVWLLYSPLHPHTCMYVPSTLPAPYAMHTLSSLAYFFQHSVLHAAPRMHTLPTPGQPQHLVPCTYTINAKRKGRGWKREVLSSL